MYEILKELGQSTRLARSDSDGKLCTLKKIDVSELPLYKKLAHISSDYIAAIYETTVIGSEFYAVFEYAEGVTLSEYIKINGVLGETEAARFACQLSDGLNVLHRVGIVHRDISPNNIIVCPTGNIKIIDFGIMRLEKFGKNTDTQLLGTPGFAAPEQYGFSQSSAKADIYALGAVINYMLTACPPNKKLADGHFSKIILKCTQIDEKNRYDNTLEVKNAIKRRFAINGAIQQRPGFRKGRRLNRLTAICYYCITVVFTIEALITCDSAAAFFTWLIMCVFTFFVPVLIIFNHRNFIDKCPLTRNGTKGDKIAFQVFGVLLSLSIAFGAALLGVL